MTTPAATPLDRRRRARWKSAYTVRRVPVPPEVRLVTGRPPAHGDLVLARVATIGQHTRLELGTSRRAQLFTGDEIVVAYGARYAPDQFEAELPTDLGPCRLVAAGGIAATVVAANSAMKPATEIVPVGLLADARGRVLTVADGALPLSAPPTARRVPTILVAGTAMNAGKTTAVASVVHGLAGAGLRVGAGKLTGTGAGGDAGAYADAGAAEVLDFTDLGISSTHRVPLPRIIAAATALHGHLAARGVDAVVLEVADGLLCADTAAVLASPAVRALVDGVVFAAGDATGAVHGAGSVRADGLPLIAVSGLVTASPLAVREAAGYLDVPVLGVEALRDPGTAQSLLNRAIRGRALDAVAPVPVA